MYKNIEKQKCLKLKDMVEYQTGQVVSRTLVQNSSVSMTIFSLGCTPCCIWRRTI
ncbi:hypothetical protein [Sporofaciens musculi]|uniref:hypothetical protein n=1 Tax=Sporofaciens musculi TaxID=2681861 RepID=UPI002AC3245D|nr:hypothetical protein [Sporofaciens musculi]